MVPIHVTIAALWPGGGSELVIEAAWCYCPNYCAVIPPCFCFLQKWGGSLTRERTHWMRRVSRVGATLSTGTGTHGKDSTPSVLEEDHLHSNFTSVRAKTFCWLLLVFYLIRWKIKSRSVQDPKFLISNVVLNPVLLHWEKAPSFF